MVEPEPRNCGPPGRILQQETVIMSHRSSSTRGFALPVAVFALVVVGVLVTGAFFVARQETQIGVATENAGMVFYATENAISEVRSNWSTSEMLNTLPNLYDDTTFVGTDSSLGVDWSVAVIRTGPRMFFLNATSTMTEGGQYAGAGHQMGMLLRLITMGFNVPGALTTHGSVSFKGAPPLISGYDRVPPHWSGQCGAANNDATGVTSDDTSGMAGGAGPPFGKGGGGGSSCPSNIEGSPCLNQDSAYVADNLDPLFEDEIWDQLVALADITLNGGNVVPGPSFVGGACDTSDDENWGDPTNPSGPCGDYFPIIHVDGTVQATGNGVGQGIMLVDGEFMATGTFDFYGVILVRGGIELRGTPAVYGGILADSADNLRGTADLLYSSCAVEKAVLENDKLNQLLPIEQRSWVDLTNIAFD